MPWPQPQPLRDALRRLRQRHRHFGVHVGADAEIFRLEGRAGAAPAAAHAAEGLPEDVLEAAGATGAASATGTACAAAAAAPGGAGKTLRAEAETFEVRVAAEASARLRAGAETLEAAECRLALGIDLAAIERLALVLVFEELMSGVQLGKARRRLRVVLVGVGMQLLGKAPIGALDVGCTCFAIEAKDLIGITHPPRTPLKLFRPAPPAHTI
jgi:hypothetical protein